MFDFAGREPAALVVSPRGGSSARRTNGWPNSTREGHDAAPAAQAPSHRQSGKLVSPTPSTGSEVTPEPSARMMKSPPAEKTMKRPSGDHAAVSPFALVRRFTPDPSGRIT